MKVTGNRDVPDRSEGFCKVSQLQSLKAPGNLNVSL